MLVLTRRTDEPDEADIRIALPDGRYAWVKLTEVRGPHCVRLGLIFPAEYEIARAELLPEVERLSSTNR